MSGSPMRGGRPRKFKSEINVVPYIDVMLVLLIIFMVAAPITNPSVINLPNAGKSNVPPTSYVNIALKPDSKATISVSGPQKGNSGTQTASSRSDLVRKLSDLHEDNPDLPVMVSADKDIKYDEVIQVLSEAKKLGISRVGLATK
ncbi:ExbD/TolR family protein [Herbaspirillum sp. RTI4]|uniref:ExbD/TolR family protein n=1 Tax=Herbaspirillum sp. RTI4 TaxID=3048640 RepID=UPI002AB351D0|nr:ExbD/TolR family protein [Herbaspirillum sp. RTI4]MDY7580000.1 ExbD/TolR family protein [Herbaspirillum sp. RTI4]MEA9982814.1 ExbD/TolR family protein [Herbaspirillum sp. RTI4]